jgi:3-methyladenine DNA glycosylase/8-oxoguanine DNA glycosylase
MSDATSINSARDRRWLILGVMAELTAIPGIGAWTVQGALIIALQREDVVLPGDLALSSTPLTTPPRAIWSLT